MTAMRKVQLTPKLAPTEHEQSEGKAANPRPRDEREQAVEEARQRESRSESCLKQEGDRGGKVC